MFYSSSQLFKDLVTWEAPTIQRQVSGRGDPASLWTNAGRALAEITGRLAVPGGIGRDAMTPVDVHMYTVQYTLRNYNTT
jgi:hypothetical protein